MRERKRERERERERESVHGDRSKVHFDNTTPDNTHEANVTKILPR